MKKNLLIRKNRNEDLWLDGYDGEEYEWTSTKFNAWRFNCIEAARKLEQVQKDHPDAHIVEYRTGRAPTGETETAQDTTNTFILFNSFTNSQLDYLLSQAGVIPESNRGYKLHQALVVWYHGSVPNNETIVELVKQANK